MEDNNKKQQASYFRAEKRVKEIRGFYIHFTIYCIVIPTLIFINLKFDPEYHWFWFSLCGWGFGLFMHWLGVFGFRLIGFGSDWEKRKIEEIMNNDTNRL